MYKSSKRIISVTHPEVSSVVKVFLTSGGAKLPGKIKNFPNTQSLTLVKRKGVEEDEVGKVTTFEVGLYFAIPPHIQLQMIASPALISHGYMLSSGVMPVPNKRSFTVQLYKFREGPDLELPYEGVYLTALQSPPVFYQRSAPEKPVRASPFSSMQSENASPHAFPEFDSQNINTLT